MACAYGSRHPASRVRGNIRVRRETGTGNRKQKQEATITITPTLSLLETGGQILAFFSAGIVSFIFHSFIYLLRLFSSFSFKRCCCL